MVRPQCIGTRAAEGGEGLYDGQTCTFVYSAIVEYHVRSHEGDRTINIPTHIVAGICCSQVVMKTIRRYGCHRHFMPWLVCFGMGIAAHLLLDLLPHYAWIVYLPGYEHLPFHWLIREGIVAGIVALPALYFTRRMWPYAIAGMIGGLYPDIEKVAYGDLNLPRCFVAFPWHSTELSSRDGGFAHGVLTCAEVLLMILILAAVWKLSATQEQRKA